MTRGQNNYETNRSTLNSVQINLKILYKKLLKIFRILRYPKTISNLQENYQIIKTIKK